MPPALPSAATSVDSSAVTTAVPASSMRGYLVWGAGLVAYVVAVLHRTSFGVAGIEATARFGASESVLATFVVVQLLVYAGLQVPVGVLLDRFGSRRLIATGALLMAVGQLVLALVHGTGLAIVARILIGGGDAMTFVSLVRLVPAWFPVRRVPLITQLTGIIGQLGQILSAVPLVAVLHQAGWTTAFSSLAAVGLLACATAAIAVRDSPRGRVVHHDATPTPVLAPLRAALREPGTWLGFWTHFVTQFSTNVFVLLWGYPFLVSAQGLSPARASLLLSLNVVAAVAAGPVLGELTARHPLRRSWMVLGVTLAMGAAWVAVLVRPDPSPFWLLTVFVMVIAIGGPASMIGFDYARTFNPPARLGTATGVVNVGGFIAALCSIYAIGVVLDLRTGPGDAYALGAFRLAFSVQVVPWAVGLAGVLVTRHLTRRAHAGASSF